MYTEALKCSIDECSVRGRKTLMIDEQEEYNTKKMILSILKEQKVSLSQTREIFESIINQIEDTNPITL